MSSDSEFARRLKWPKSPGYSIAEESFAVHVPKGWSAGKAFGLIVWISPTDEGSPPSWWKELLDSNRLVWVGANGAGNDRYSYVRSGLALDAAHAFVPHYDLDPGRVYIAGFSGGGRAASRLALAYPDVFSGGVFIGGCNYVRKIPLPSNKTLATPDFAKPPAALFRKAARESSLVLVSGESDFNLEQIRTVFDEGFVKDKFAHAACFIVPGIGHDLPDESWMGKAISALESPVEDSAEEDALKAVKAASAGKLGEALDLFERTARRAFRRPSGAAALREAAALQIKLSEMKSEMNAFMESGDREKAVASARRIVSLFGRRAGAAAVELADSAKTR